MEENEANAHILQQSFSMLAATDTAVTALLPPAAVRGGLEHAA